VSVIQSIAHTASTGKFPEPRSYNRWLGPGISQADSEADDQKMYDAALFVRPSSDFSVQSHPLASQSVTCPDSDNQVEPEASSESRVLIVWGEVKMLLPDALHFQTE
jgi:hypothetical protein